MIVVEKVVKMLINVKNVREEVNLCKCTKWEQVCTNKFKKFVMNVREKDKLLNKNAKLVKELKFLKNKK